MNLKSRAHGIFAIGLALGLASSLPAQERESSALQQQQRLIDEKLKQQRRDLAPLDSAFDFQWGGWVDYYFFDFNDGVQSQRLLSRPSASLWGRVTLDDGAHEFFARGRLSFSYYSSGDEYEREQDWIGPNLDRGWYQIDIGKAFRLTSPGDPIQAKIKVGRQEIVFGTGYALDLPMDAVRIEGKLADLRVVGLFGKTIASYPNIDNSDPVDTHSSRRFYGVEATYTGLEGHEPFAYALWNDDYTDERPKDFYQDYSYDSQYFGFGSRGQIIRNLNYWGEAVWESGHSFGDGDFRQQDYIQAWAWDAGLEYLFVGEMKPRVSFEYMFASGDGGRVYSPTNAAGGNSGDNKDTSFSGFGYRDTGIAAGPRLSNIHIWRAGASFLPAPKNECTRDLELGSNWFLYHKNASRGAISDSTAGDFEGFVGWEMDYFINWRLTSDLSWTFRWGLFFPGDAYLDQTTRSFFFTGVTWSF